MTHRMTVWSNPRILILFAVIAAMFGVSIIAFIRLGALLGVVFFVGAAYLTYNFSKFVRSSLRSAVTTSEDGIVFDMPSGDRFDFDWDTITIAGICEPARGRSYAFFYREADDKFVTVTREYERFDAFVEEASAGVTMERIQLPRGTSIQQHLRELLHLDES